MKYNDLDHLIRESSSSRRYFLSLPVSTQMDLHKHNKSIHTAAELHRHVSFLEAYNRQVLISEGR